MTIIDPVTACWKLHETFNQVLTKLKEGIRQLLARLTGASNRGLSGYLRSCAQKWAFHQTQLRITITNQT
jgi:hypothetical protein